MKPLLFLEYDGVLAIPENLYVVHDLPTPARAYGNAFPAPRAQEFVKWIMGHFQVVWLTLWPGAPDSTLARIRALSNLPVPALRDCDTPSYQKQKHLIVAQYLLATPERPFFWVDSYFTPEARKWAIERGVVSSLLVCNSMHDPDGLYEVHRELAERISVL